MKILLVLPTQLFEANPLVPLMEKVYVIEEPFYFTRLKFHKQKLMYHRATMRYYYDVLRSNPACNVEYIDYKHVHYKRLFKKATHIHLYDPIDIPVLEHITKCAKAARKHTPQLHVHDTPAFLETRAELEDYRNHHTNKQNYYHDASFYRWQRRRLNILMDNNHITPTPLFNKWSFDKDNRTPFPTKYEEAPLKMYSNTPYIKEAIQYVRRNFVSNFGELTTDTCYYPVTHEDAKRHLRAFLQKKLSTFGTYQDAVSPNVVFGSHSALSPMLNIGLLTPALVVQETLKAFNNSKNTQKQRQQMMPSVEGFLRQVIGWRSYVRFIYMYHGTSMTTMNFLGHKNKLHTNWYTASTGMQVIDSLIDKVRTYAYLHHIERLMYIGNFALLTQIHPQDIYTWFMICFIDSYEWVMVPNVFGMSQHSLTDISMMTRPYFSSSNYIKKMSTPPPPKQTIQLGTKEYVWSEVWDALYYTFINKHKDYLKTVYATAMQVKHWETMSKEKQRAMLHIANTYMKTYINA